MPANKPPRLNEVLGPLAPEGHNDARWFLTEHQMQQVKMSAQIVVGNLKIIAENPENESEREIAEDCLSICLLMFRQIQETYAAFLSYLSDTEVSERISRKEL